MDVATYVHLALLVLMAFLGFLAVVALFSFAGHLKRIAKALEEHGDLTSEAEPVLDALGMPLTATTFEHKGGMS